MDKHYIICGSSAPKLINSIRISAFRQASNSNQRGDDLAERLQSTDDAATFSCHKNCISLITHKDI